MIRDAEVANAWPQHDRDERVRLSKIGCVLALILIPAGIGLDSLVYPDYLGYFIVVRFIADLLVLSVFIVHFTDFAHRHVRPLIMVWLAIPQIAICYMIYLTDGFSSPYYAGLNLAILGMGTVLPVTVIEVVILTILTLVLYGIAGLAHGAIGPVDPLFYNNLFFIVTTSIISSTAVYFNRKRRIKTFELNFELENRNKELTELDQLKSEFIANVSHELRTPLTLILAPLDRLLQEHRQLPAQIRQQLEMMHDNSLRLLRLVNDLLDTIRLEQGQTSLECRDLRLDTLLDGLVESMSPLADARGITLQNRLTATPVSISGDRSALEKIFLNLLNNAIKFTHESGQVVVRSQPGFDSITVTIADTGIGMSSDSLLYIFDRFRQADSSSARRYGGTGLGLALVKDLTERHGGEVSVFSKPGRGTSFDVTLPTLAAGEGVSRCNPEEPETEPAPQLRLDRAARQSAVDTRAEPVADIPGSPSDWEGTLLIVDDEPDMRRYLVDLLQNEYRVLVARDGQEGLDMIDQFRPELIILDLMLPGIDGLEVCRRIKQNPELCTSRIVLLTARAEEPSKLVALQNGADDFLTKPFSGVEVGTRLRNLLRSSALERDLQRRNQELEETTADLRQTQDQLVHSEKLNALGRLAAGLLHEINNPLNYTLAGLQFAKDNPVVESEEELKETLADIDDGMQRIRNIVKELRAFAYPANGEQTEFQVLDAINAALQLLAHDARGVNIDNRIDSEWVVIGSRNHITQVVVNLLSNAFKAMPSLDIERQNQVTLSAQPEGARILISVRDNGSGIPAEAIERVFDPFYTTADVGEGMGMGLSVCQTIIRNHDGELRVDSKEGEWTEFSFDLSLKTSSASEVYLEDAWANSK